MVAYKSGLGGYQSVALWKGGDPIETDVSQVEKRVARIWDHRPNVGEALRESVLGMPVDPKAFPNAVRGEQNRLREGSCGRNHLPGKEAHFGKQNPPRYPMCSGRNRNLDQKIETPETRPFPGYHRRRVLGDGSSHQFGAVLVGQFENFESNGRTTGKRDWRNR